VRVALDARKLFDGGIGSYIRGLLGALAAGSRGDEWTALVDPADVGRVRWPGAVRERPVRAGKYGLAEHFAVPAEARRAHAELLHAPHYTLPLGWAGPSVVTIHDLIHIRFARFHGPGAALYARVMAGLAARRARGVIVDSESTRTDVIELLATPEAKVRVIPLGVSTGIRRVDAESAARFNAERALPAGHVLYVGARKRHKNLELLLHAWATMPAAERPPLVLSGPAWTAREPLAVLAGTLGVANSIRFAGELRDERELSCLYSGAALLVQPSLAEGFGLPPLEAMACGTPVVSTTGGSLGEVLGDAALTVAPGDVVAFAGALARALDDEPLREWLRAQGLARAATFTWTRTADATILAYRAAARAKASA
jgi:glycosyltransferase involved in cell wall biosynthesis